MYDFMYENFIDQRTVFDEAKSSSRKTPIDFEDLDPFEAEDVNDGVFDERRYLTERRDWEN